MEKLFIRELAIPALIGVFDSEKITPQTLFIDLEIAVDAGKAALSDDIRATIDYSAIYHYLQEYIPTTRFQLLETLAVNIAESLIKNYRLQWLRLTVTKKPGDMPNIAGAGIIIERP